jgi:hypothetical protein
MVSINDTLYIVNTNIYEYLRVQDGKNLQYTCKDIAQQIAELKNKPAFISDPTKSAPFKPDIYTEDLEGNATLYELPLPFKPYSKIGCSKIKPRWIDKLLNPEAPIKYAIGFYCKPLLDYGDECEYEDMFDSFSESQYLKTVKTKEEARIIVDAIKEVKKSLDNTRVLINAHKVVIRANKKAEFERLNGTKDRPKVSIQSSIVPTNPWGKKHKLL